MASAFGKRCIIEALKGQYRSPRKRRKGVIITELCERIGVGRTHAIRL
jgi:hypothetical protein